jgi:hypothetical protein
MEVATLCDAREGTREQETMDGGMEVSFFKAVRQFQLE